MKLSTLKSDDPRLRTVCAALTPAQLRAKEQQTEIDGLLQYVGVRGNKAVPGEVQDVAIQSVVGLSANQVGLMKQICIVDLSIGRKGYYDLHVLVNPKIVWRSKSTIAKNEGCVNFTTIRGITKRSRTVKIEALDRSGNEVALKLTGWPAVLLQHEIDHLNGHLFIDRLPDPTVADLVVPGEYQKYRKQSSTWKTKIDVSAIIKPDKA
jgi:peptide deformylase